MERGAKYFGEITEAGCSVYVKHGDKWVPLQRWFNMEESAAPQFAWGLECSGAARLSLAILTDHLESKSRALDLYRDFELLVVARLNRDEWLLSGEEIDEAIATIEQMMQRVA